MCFSNYLGGSYRDEIPHADLSGYERKSLYPVRRLLEIAGAGAIGLALAHHRRSKKM